MAQADITSTKGERGGVVGGAGEAGADRAGAPTGLRSEFHVVCSLLPGIQPPPQLILIWDPSANCHPTGAKAPQAHAAFSHGSGSRIKTKWQKRSLGPRFDEAHHQPEAEVREL